MTEAWNKIAQSFKCSPIEGERLPSKPVMRCLGQARAAHACMSFSLHILRFEKAVKPKVQSAFQFEVVASPNVNKPGSLFQRYAVPSAEATRHWWREDHHSEPNRPAKVYVEKSQAGDRQVYLRASILSIMILDAFIHFKYWFLLMSDSSLCSFTCFHTQTCSVLCC